MGKKGQEKEGSQEDQADTRGKEQNRTIYLEKIKKHKKDMDEDVGIGKKMQEGQWLKGKED